jgi:hypothetical protein
MDEPVLDLLSDEELQRQAYGGWDDWDGLIVSPNGANLGPLAGVNWRKEGF